MSVPADVGIFGLVAITVVGPIPAQTDQTSLPLYTHEIIEYAAWNFSLQRSFAWLAQPIGSAHRKLSTSDRELATSMF